MKTRATNYELMLAGLKNEETKEITIAAFANAMMFVGHMMSVPEKGKKNKKFSSKKMRRAYARHLSQADGFIRWYMEQEAEFTVQEDGEHVATRLFHDLPDRWNEYAEILNNRHHDYLDNDSKTDLLNWVLQNVHETSEETPIIQTREPEGLFFDRKQGVEKGDAKEVKT